MRNRADEIRKRIEKRRRARQPSKKAGSNPYFVNEEEKHGGPPFYDFDSDSDRNKNHPLIRKEWLMFQVMAAVCLFLVVGIMFKSTSPQWDKGKALVNETFEKEFQFATVSNWYEKQFGKPLALLPVEPNSERKTETVGTPVTSESVYAVPAAGRVMETFATNGQGIMVQTGAGSLVEAIDEGFVVFAGVKKDTGKTVEIQHADGSTTYYGNLKDINVKLYEFVKTRTALGEVNATEDGKSGVFYFAIKKGDSFIDPNKVIPFE